MHFRTIYGTYLKYLAKTNESGNILQRFNEH